MQVARRQLRIAQVQVQPLGAGEVHGRPLLHVQHQGGVVAEHESDPQEQQQRHSQQGRARAAQGPALERLQVGSVVGEDQHHDDREPAPAHEDRTGEEELAVDGLQEEQRSHPQGHRGGDQRRGDLAEGVGELRPRGGRVPALQPGVEGQDQTAQHGVHRHQVQQEGQVQQDLQQEHGRRQRQGVGRRHDHGGHHESLLSPVAGEAAAWAPAPSGGFILCRNLTKAARCSAVPK